MRTPSETKKLHILDATRRLLVDRGYQNIVLDDVAQEAGVAKGTLFLYYKSKEDLFASVFADLVDQLGKSLAVAAASPLKGEALLVETVRTILAYFDRNRDFLSQFGGGRFPSCGGRSNVMLMEKFRENIRSVSAILKNSLSRTGDLTYESVALIGLCRSAMLLNVMVGSKEPLAKQTPRVLGLFLKGVKALLLMAVLGIAARAAEVKGRPIELKEAYQLSLKRSEQLAQRSESITQALARVDELRSAVLPHVYLNGSQQFQQSPNSATSALNNTSIPTLQLTATQPIFAGFRDFLAFKAGKKAAESQSLDKQRAEALLYQDVAQAFLNLLRLQKEVGIRQVIITNTEDRIKQLESWIRIGRSRESEALAARAQLAQVDAQVEITLGQEEVAQEALMFLTGLDERLVPQDLPLPGLSPLEPYVDAARKRSDVAARSKDLEYSSLYSEITRRQRYPTLGLTADYFLKRTGSLANTHYDATFALSQPLYLGGQIDAQTREAEAVRRSAEQGVSLAARAAENQVRTAYRSLKLNLAAGRALKKAADLAKANLKSQTDDYRLRLVTNLEVLDSLNTLQTTLINLNFTEQQALFSGVQLQVAAGDLK